MPVAFLYLEFRQTECSHRIFFMAHVALAAKSAYGWILDPGVWARHFKGIFLNGYSEITAT